MSLLGNIVRSNKKEAGGAGGVASANNGLSLDTATGTVVQIGNDTGLATAILLNDREIPMGGFSFLMHSGGNDQLLIDPAGSYKIGDIDNSLGKNSFIDIDAVNGIISSLQIDGLGNTGQWNTSNNGSFISQDDGTFVYTVRTQSNNAALVSIETGNGRAHVDAVHDSTNPYARMFAQNETASDFLRARIFRDSFDIAGGVAGVTATLLNLNTATGLYQIGDIAAFNNGTFLSIDDGAQTVNIFNNANTYLNIDIPNKLYVLGDVGGSNNGTAVTVDDNTGNVQLFAATAANSATLTVDAAAKTFTMSVNGGAGQGGIITNAPSATGAGLWLLGKRVASAVAFDATQYIEVMIDGTLRKLALAA